MLIWAFICHLKQALLCIWNNDKTPPACFYCSAFPKSQRPGFGAQTQLLQPLRPCGKHNWVLRDSVTRWNCFLKFSKHFNQYINRYNCLLKETDKKVPCIHWWFSRSLKSLSLPYTTINFLFASLKWLTNFENAYWNPPQNPLLCDWSMFPSAGPGADPSLAAGKMRKN